RPLGEQYAGPWDHVSGPDAPGSELACQAERSLRAGAVLHRLGASANAVAPGQMVFGVDGAASVDANGPALGPFSQTGLSPVPGTGTPYGLGSPSPLQSPAPTPIRTPSGGMRLMRHAGWATTVCLPRGEKRDDFAKRTGVWSSAQPLSGVS